MKVNDDVKAALPGVIGDAATPKDKLQRIYDFCRTKIKNTSDDANGMSADEKAKLKDNKTPADTLKRGMGAGLDIDLLLQRSLKPPGSTRAWPCQEIVTICFSAGTLPTSSSSVRYSLR